MEGSFKQIDIHEAKEMIDKGNVTLIDIRDQQSFAAGHIENAVSVNDENIVKFWEETDKNKTLICYCYHGINSQSAAMFLKDKGFKEVYSITGGFEEYKQVYG